MCQTQGVHLFAVSDGHGQHGHRASQYIKDALTTHLTEYLANDKDFNSNPP
jgi:serine/threonine protein phosphatase PrpC